MGGDVGMGVWVMMGEEGGAINALLVLNSGHC